MPLWGSYEEAVDVILDFAARILGLIVVLELLYLLLGALME